MNTFYRVGHGSRHVAGTRPMAPMHAERRPDVRVETHWTRILYRDLLRDDGSAMPHSCSASTDTAPRSADGAAKHSRRRHRLTQLRLWLAPAAIVLALQVALALAMGGLLLLAPLLHAKPNVAHPGASSTTAAATNAQD